MVPRIVLTVAVRQESTGQQEHCEISSKPTAPSCVGLMSKEVPTMPQASQGERPGLQNLEWYRIMRDNDPVWRDPKTGLWNVFRYEDVAAVLADYRTFSSDFSQFFPEQAELIEGNIVATDRLTIISFGTWSAKLSHPVLSPVYNSVLESSPRSCWIRLGGEPASNWSRISLTRCQ